MSSGGDDRTPSPSAYLEAPSSQSLILDAKPLPSRTNLTRPESDATSLPSGDESSDEERENRFAGPASTWRGYTADERALAASLDLERANDLSAHLYNAFALKSRLYDPDVARRAKRWHSKQRWITPDEEGSIPWHPDQTWTAWPLHADDVPRKSERFGIDPLREEAAEAKLKKPLPWRPGSDLEEEIQVLMLQKAKKRFHDRSWELDREESQSTSKPHRSVSHMASSPPSAAASRRSSLENDMRPASADAKITQPSTEHFGKPSILADDDQANRLLKQGTRHVMSCLDDVLLGLHRSRQHHFTGASGQDEMSKKTQSHKRKRRSTGGEMPPLPDHDQAPDNINLKAPKRTAYRDYSKHPSGPHALGTRDWSEVIGMALLTGWNPSVVERAAKRCASLFAERMTVRQMPETAAGHAADTLTEYKPELVSDLDTSDEEGEGSEEEGQNVHRGYNCPEEACTMHHRYYEKRWMIRQHLKQKHKYDAEALGLYDDRHAAVDAKLSIEQLEVDGGGAHEAQHQGERNTPPPAVETDGYNAPLDVRLGRGSGVQVRKEKERRGSEET